jgi:5S rRNA maturation endonuclease (ribonuclease M5)
LQREDRQKVILVEGRQRTSRVDRASAVESTNQEPPNKTNTADSLYPHLICAVREKE